MPIRFGSDGFRGIIGGGFTRESVTRIALAVNNYVASQADGGSIPVGYDTRFLSQAMAELACRLIQGSGINSPLLAYAPCPSPYIAFCARALQRPVAIQITASHNPPYYNGVKLKAGYGGSLIEANVRDIEAAANAMTLLDHPSRLHEPTEYLPLDMRPEYAAAIDAAAGPVLRAPVIVDYMHGATPEVYGGILRSKLDVRGELRRAADPLFGGSRPEPLEPLLGGLIEAVRSDGHGSIGLAFDGDGDRLAVVDENGRCLPSHEIFAILLEHLAQSGYPGKRVVTTVSFSSLLARIAAHYGLEVTEVPVGFKHVSAEMLAGDVLIGGEESGGAALGHYLPERDALLMALTVLAARERAGKPLSAIVDDIHTRYGKPCYVHVDVQLGTAEAAQKFRERLPELLGLGIVARDAVSSTSDRDGVKLRTESGWVLVRASGTEPLARFYAEANSVEQARAYITAAQEFLGVPS